MLEFSESLTVNQKNDKLLLTAVSCFRNIYGLYWWRCVIVIIIALMRYIILITFLWRVSKQLLDRETRREKVIEAKNRELRLKMKTVRQDSGDHADAATRRSLADLKDPLIVQCEQEYQATIEAVINQFLKWTTRLIY